MSTCDPPPGRLFPPGAIINIALEVRRRIRAAGQLSPLCAYLAGVSLSLVGGGWLAAALAGIPAAVLLGASLTLALRYGTVPRSNHSRGRVLGAAAILLLPGLVCLGLTLGSVRLALLGESLLGGLQGKWASVEVTVGGAPKLNGTLVSFVAHAESARQGAHEYALDEDILVQLYCRKDCASTGADRLEEGMRLRLGGTLKPPPASPGADFDYSVYLHRRGINALLAGSDGYMERLPARGGLWGAIDAARSHCRRSLAAGDWGPASAVLQGMVLGDTRAVPEDVIADFRSSGLLHLMAVSGQNVVLLGFIVMLLCRLVLVPRFWAVLLSILVVAAYVPLTGAGPSIVRAGIVGILGLLALLLGRQTDRYHFLALAAAVILTINPYSLLDPGFQLSFAAVLAIFLVAPAFSCMLGALPALLREGIAISTAVGLVTAPIMLIHFKQLSLVTVPANIAAEPVAGPVMLIGVLAVLAACFSPQLVWLLDALGSASTGYLISVAGFFASLPGAVYNANPPGLLATGLFYGMLGVMTALARSIGLIGALRWLLARRQAALAAVLVLLLAGSLACAASSRPGAPPTEYTVSFLDVGQGDAALVQVPGGATVLIDGGPGSSVLDRLKENGVVRLDAVVLTHPHADHLDGLLPVLDDYPVDRVYDAGAVTASPAYRDFLHKVEDKSISYSAVHKGDIMAFGDLQMNVLSPSEPPADEANPGSLVLLISYHGLDILDPGDAEGEVLATLDLPRVQVLKVAHHGSSDNQLDQALAKLKPQVAVISVGAGNRYGHPAQSTLDKLAKAGARVLETQDSGTIHVSLGQAGAVVRTDR